MLGGLVGASFTDDIGAVIENDCLAEIGWSVVVQHVFVRGHQGGEHLHSALDRIIRKALDLNILICFNEIQLL